MVIPVLITGLCAQNVSYGSIVFVFQSQTRRLKLMILFLCAKVVNVNADDCCKRAWLSALHWLSTTMPCSTATPALLHLGWHADAI